MLLQLIKTQEMISGCHCQLWEINHLSGNRLLGEMFVLNEHMPLELIYRLTVTQRGISVRGQHCGWQWDHPADEIGTTAYLRGIQFTREEIRLEVCTPPPHLPGYPYINYHPRDYPIVFDG